MNKTIMNLIILGIFGLFFVVVIGILMISIVKEVKFRKKKIDFTLPDLDKKEIKQIIKPTKDSMKLQNIEERKCKIKSNCDEEQEEMLFNEYEKEITQITKKTKKTLPEQGLEEIEPDNTYTVKPFHSLDTFDNLMEDLEND